MSNNKRPLSPHLSIYKLPLAAKLSILHRATGVALFLGSLLVLWVTIYIIYSNNEIGISENIFLNILTKIMLFGWSFSLFYHLANGVRHLFWDIGKGFDLKTVYLTNYLVISFSLISTILSWLVIYGII